MEAINRGWAMGKAAAQLTGIRWEQYWGMPVEKLRKKLNILL